MGRVVKRYSLRGMVKKTSYKNKLLKSLLISLAVIGAGTNMAKADTYAPVPTLTKLHNEGATIPNTNPPIVYTESTYTVTNGTSTNYNFATHNYDNNGNLVTNYYKINMDESKFNLNGLKWQEVNGVNGTDDLYELILPNNDKHYYNFTYNKPSNYSNLSRITNLSSSINNVVFYNQATNAIGGAILNTNNIQYNINSDFIENHVISTTSRGAGGAVANLGGNIGNVNGNFAYNWVVSYINSGDDYTTLAAGGAIYNTPNNVRSSIKDITGNFIGNSVESKNNNVYTFASGGAIANEASSIGNITGNFISNSAEATNNVSGGAITNVRAEWDNTVRGSIGNISGDFIDNNIKGNEAFGGAIINQISDIKNITGDFLNNFIEAGSLGNGGAIFNSEEATIQNITGNFIGNHITTSPGTNDNTSDGGAIYNYGTINNIKGDFAENYVITSKYGYGGAISNDNIINSVTGNFDGNNIQSTLSSYGGAISNTGTITNGIVNSNFYNNYVKSTNGTAYGGAIYTDSNLDIIANNGTSTFRGNYTNSKGTIDKNAIYTDGANATVRLKAQNNGHIYIYDNIKGTSNSNVVMTGNSTGTIHLYNDIKGPKVTVNNVNVDMVNNDTHNYNFTSLNSNANAKYNIDVNLQGSGSSDKITTSNTSEGTVTLNDINLMNVDSANNDSYTIQVLNTQNNNLKLAVGNNLANKEFIIKNLETEHKIDEIKKDAKWNDKFESYDENSSKVGTVGIGTTSTTNDSLKFNIETKTTKTNIESLGDTLALVNQLDTAEDRSFTFDTANDKYNATSDLGTTTAGKLSINGEVLRSAQNDVIARSEINLNGHKGFELDNETTLNVNDTRLTGNDTLITVNNQNAIVNLQNADLNGSIASENSYTLNITGDTSDRTIINGTVGKASTTHNGGEVKFNTDTFNDAEFSTLNGTVDLVTGQVENYDIGKLTSDESSNWIFEVDSSGSGADTLTVGTGSSGTVNVSEINFINGDSPSDEFTVKLLNAEDDNIQLAVDPSIAGENHKLGTVTKTSQDTVTPTAKWNQTFNKYTQNGTNYGNIDVATTNTTNDSLQLKVTSTEWDEKAVSGSMGDTLALVNQLETEENRNFNFDSASDVYEVKSDLGTTSAGVMNVNGILRSAQNDGSGQAERSTINGNNYNMFVLSNPTTLNLNNVKVTGANSVASGTNKSAVINMNNVELKNNASGITTAGSVNISGKSVFENNGNGIEVTDEDSIITLNGLDGDGYDVVFKDKLKGVSGAKLNLKAGQVEFHKSVTDLDINMAGTTANLKADNVFNGQNLTVASASDISMINNSVGTMQLNSLTLNDNMNLGVDVDLANKSMDRISANTYNLGDNKINVNKMNLLSDAKEVRTDIEFADENLRNNVTTSVSEVAYSPIYKYGVKYDKDNGEFQFTRSNSGGGGGGNTPSGGGSGRPTYNDLNPAIMASPVAAQMGGYAGMLDNYGNALNHMDMFMLKPLNMRKAELNANKYAIADGSNGTYLRNETNTTGIWVRPYTSYDSVNMKHGPKVNNLTYGSFIGGDFGMHDFGNGLYGEFSPYISYQGAHQHYSGNSVYQNGGSLGFTGTLYKGNFFTGLTAGVGANVTEASTMYGNEDFPMLSTGVASKTGYNIEFKDGKFIIQPSLLVSYTFVNTFDYKNAAGVRIDTAPLHAVQINPNIRFSFNTKNHWQPYAFVGMNWNIMDSGHFKAADTTLPELSIKPYIQYGLGIQKLFSDNFTAFAQVAVRNGGRNGVGGTLGMKWILGGQPKKQEEQKQKDVL